MRPPSAPRFGGVGTLAGLVLAVALGGNTGCATDAFCYANCETATVESSHADGGTTTGGFGGHFTGEADADCFPYCAEAGAGGGCQPSNGGVEACDGVDNDCNGKVDEGIDLARPDHCGTCDTDCFVSATNCAVASVRCVPPKAPGSPGTCACDACDPGWVDLPSNPKHGLTCDYACAKTGDTDATCDNLDDDCDGVKDEDVDFCGADDCGSCGHKCAVVHGKGQCVRTDPAKACDSPGNTECQLAACDCKGPGDCWWHLPGDPPTICSYQCDVTNGGVEVCGDGVDNDCNGLIDGADPNVAADPQIGKLCHGGAKGECAAPAHAGATECQGKQILCAGPDVLVPNAVLETCNGKDDDCDGLTDNAATDAGGSCGGFNVAPCALGVLTCVGGALACVGAIGPAPETCDGMDNDCNGVIDDAPIDAGGTCGKSGQAPCALGKVTCIGGSLACVGNVDPEPETCNGKDDDCSGTIDDNVPDVGAVCGASGKAPCQLGAIQCVGGKLSCVGALDPQPETCNGKDDDCNGKVDDAPADAGQSCGKGGQFPCKVGVTVCQGGAISCVGAVDPQPEACNGKDDDCNGVIDDQPVGVGGACGQNGVAPCKLGAFQCQGGALVCVGAVDPKAETCNGVDDDCNGKVDDGAAGVGATCGASGVAPCKLGAFACQGGALVCVGAKDPVPETCNGVDDDCDGKVDDNPTDVGAACGKSNVAPCSLGTLQCKAGALACVGAVDPQSETCNGKDDDCDGKVDLTGNVPPPEAVGACNVPLPPPANATSPCKAGAKACQGGGVVCVGSAGPTGPNDTCGVDANCDGKLTSQPDLATDAAHCGSCGNDCNAGAVHASFGCAAGVCVYKGCEPGYWDLDGDKKCEYACTYLQAQEQCNGNDDNCNGQIDEGVLVPSPVQVCGVSPSAIRAECTSQVGVACKNGTWQCTFPVGVCGPSCSKAAEFCDGLDNNCNGALNENVGNYGKACASDDGKPAPGDGACRTVGTFACDGPAATKCSAVKADCAGLPGGCVELCDGIDNDCDGLVDESFKAKGAQAAYFVKPVVTKVAASTWMYTYEASRPSASGSVPGMGNGYFCSGAACSAVPPAPAGVTLDKTPACSVAGKIPWFNVTPTEVEQTCQAMGGSVCATADWTTACQATSSCTWAYSPRGAACTSDWVAGTKYCNLGPSYDFDPITAGMQSGLLPTASADLKGCSADWSGLLGNVAGKDKLYDVTGNLREITRSAAGKYPLMGGAFDSGDTNGATCGFAFYTVDASFQLFDLGFRCCFSADPTL